MKLTKMKIFAVLVALFLLSVGGVFYYASTKLRPEEIKKIAIEQTQAVFPNATVELQNVSIGWGLNFAVNLEKLSINLKKDNQKIEMMSVDQLVLKVPLWAILTGGGVIDVKLDAPIINYHEFPEGNNWTQAMGGKKPDSPKAEDAKKDADKSGSDGKPNMALGIFGKSKINIKISDVNLKYMLKDGSKGDLKVARFLIKGLNFESSTAFEIASSAKFVMKDNSSIGFDTLIIGEFNIADLLKNGSVSTLVIVKLNNISKSGLDWKFPEITTNLEVQLKKDGELSGKVTTRFESQNKISANFKVTKKIEIKDLNIEIILKDVAAIMGVDKSIDLSKSKLLAKGNVVYGEDKKIDAALSFSIAPGIVYAKDGMSASTTVAGEFKGHELSVKAKVETFEGQLVTSVSGEFDPNEKFDIKKLKPFDIRVVASGMKIPEKFIRSKLWDKKLEDVKVKSSEQKAEKAPEDEKNADAAPKAEAVAMGIPPSAISLDWSNINIGGEDFSGHGKILTTLTSVSVDDLNFKFSKGSGKISQTMQVGNESTNSKFNLEILNLNLSAFKAFLPPFIENFSGTFTGKVNGAATMFKKNAPPIYDVNVIVDAKKGEIKKLNISEYINPLLANIPIVKDKMKEKEFKIDGNFETLTMKGRFTNALYTLSSVDFMGLEKKVQITGSGEIYPQAGTKLSTMEVNFIDNTGKISNVLQENVGTRILPMKLSGSGFALKPDYAFTVSKLAKGALKTKGEAKVKEVIQKNIEKLVPEAAKEKVKNLLDGFFKKK